VLRVVTNSDGKLFGKLGNWQQPGGQLRRRWNDYFDYPYKFLYRYDQEQYIQYELFDTRFINGCASPRTPNDYCVPVTIQETGHDCWMLTAPPALPDHPERPIVSHTFAEYLRCVPEHEQHRFPSVDLLFDPYEIISIFNDDGHESTASDDDTLILDNTPTPTTTIHMVSDGSELSQKMTFRWVLCTASGQRLFICSGPAFGTGSSHRAEATGMLSAPRFLHHLVQYCNTVITNPLNYISDNKGLITRMTQGSQYDDCFPNATLAPDWDLAEAIHSSVQHLFTAPLYRHALGHQDKTKSYSQLSLTAQLNVDANETASAFHFSHAPTTQEDVPLTPTTKAQFSIGTTTITGHYKHHIRSKAAS
jgi:hypothetical protein